MGGDHDVVAVLGRLEEAAAGRTARCRLKIWMPGSASSQRIRPESSRADDPRHDGEQDVEGADVLVVGRESQRVKNGGRVGVVVVVAVVARDRERRWPWSQALFSAAR